MKQETLAPHVSAGVASQITYATNGLATISQTYHPCKLKKV